jgi:dTDP-glucose 4,6-dehydratase
MAEADGRPVRPERRLEGRTFLVTGGAGFIGSNLIRWLLTRYPELRIVNLDKLTYAGNLENLRDVEANPRYEFIQGDIRDRDLVRTILPRVWGVVHLAAETHVDRSILDAGEFVLTDVYGSFVLFEALRQAGQVEIFLHVSTDEVYGSRPEGFFSEEDRLEPSSPYSASKAGADRLARAYCVTYGSPIVILRPSNNYGPFQYPEKFIPLFATHALEGLTLPLYGDGRQVRDWLHVEDHCRAIDAVLRRGLPGEVFNVAANNEVPNIEVARRIVALLGRPENLIKTVPDRPGHDRRYALDCRRIRGLGWRPEIPFEDGLAATVRWYEAHPAWWKAIKEKSREFKSFYDTYYKDRR